MNMLSVLILFVVVGSVGLGIYRGRHRSAPEAMIRLAVLLLCILLAALPASLIPRLIPDAAIDFLTGFIVIGGEYTTYTGFDGLLRSIVRGMASPLIFLVLFLLIWMIASVILNRVFRSRRKNLRQWQTEEVRKQQQPLSGERMWGPVMGAIAGLLVCVACFSPLTGTLRIMDSALTTFDRLDGIRLDSLYGENRRQLTRYAHDPILTFLYACGGQMIYESTATGELMGDSFYIGDELDTCDALLNDLHRLTNQMMLGEFKRTSDFRKLSFLVEDARSSPVCRFVLMGLIEKQSDQWLESFRIQNKDETNVMAPMIEAMLTNLPSVIQETTVCEDIQTVIRIYELIMTKDLGGTDYTNILSVLGAGGGLDSINEIFQQNERMRFISESLSEMAMLSFLYAVREQKQEAPDTYRILVSDLTETLNRSAYYSDERRINDIRNCLKDYAFILQLDANENILTVVTFRLMECFHDREVTVMEEDVYAVLEGRTPEASEDISEP